MEFDLKKLQEEISGAPLHSPYPLDVAVAIVNDCFRAAGKPPVADKQWEKWRRTQARFQSEQMGVLAHFLARTSLREATVRALGEIGDRRSHLPDFFKRIEPLNAEMIRANPFRQEEFLRNWARWCGADIAGESARESRERLESLDYRKTLEEYGRAERARKKEEEKRRKLLREAQEREAAARGWRE